MCGKNQGLLTKAILEMVTTVLNGAFSLADNIIKMKEQGVDADSLTSTIQTFIDMGKPFANPTCPEWDHSTAAPTPAPGAICSEPCGLGVAPGNCRLETGGFVICLAANGGGMCAEGQTSCSGEESNTRPAVPNVAVCQMNTKVYLSGHGFQIAGWPRLCSLLTQLAGVGAVDLDGCR